MQRRLLDEAALVPAVDVYFAVEPDSAAAGVKLARANAARTVFDIHEIYHDDMLRRWVPNWARGTLGTLVRKRIARVCAESDLVVGAGWTRIEPYLCEAQKTLVIHHCLPRSEGRKSAADPFGKRQGPVRIMHGKGSISHGTREMLRALPSLVRRVPADVRVIVFNAFAANEGFGRSDLLELATALGVKDRLELRDPVPFREMGQILDNCNLGLIGYRREMGVNSMPNRIFEFMSYGIPSVCPSYSRELRALVGETHCGLLTDIENPEALASSLASLILDPELARTLGENGRRATLDKYNIEHQVAPLLAWIFDPAEPLPQAQPEALRRTGC